ncbi:MAG: EthD domain-containing protein [Panacagrimonas sp.]
MSDISTQVSTVALLARREGMSVDLFSRYWRDVHGVLAVRIPGFWSYTQYHVALVSPRPSDDSAFVMDGLAEVEFLNEADRTGLATSDVIPLILRDEQNVFSRTLLYSLEAGASRTRVAASAAIADYSEPSGSYVLLVQSPPDVTAQAAAAALESALMPVVNNADLESLRTHLLASGDPTLWNTAPGVDNAERSTRNSAVIQAQWKDEAAALAALEMLTKVRDAGICEVQAYWVTARCAMVAQGRPTHLGLRGLDALRTIEAAGADNQKEAEVLRRLYGDSMIR